jgi:hypothetical protein
LKIFNPYPYIIDFRDKELPVVFEIAFFKKGILEFKKNLDLPAEISELKVGETISVDCRFTLKDLPPGSYKMAICSETGMLYIASNSRFREARITD